MKSLSGEMLDGKYKVGQLLGKGGMGSVYKAVHLGTTRTVAIKVIHAEFAGNSEFITRFQREAEAAGRLRHPNVVDVTDFGFATTQTGPVAYLVMEYLDGCSLAEVLNEEGRLPLPWVVDIIEQASSAIDEAHRSGLVHRDLKPENIWLEPNRRGGFTVKVLDFGLVKLGAPEAKLEPGTRTENGAQLTEDASMTSPTRRQTIPVKSGSTIPEAATLINPLGQADHEDAVTLLQAEDDQQDSRSADRNSTLRLPRHEMSTTSPIETAASTDLTRIGSIMGTPAYMSPEQFRGESVDLRSDIYSLGAIVYRMLTGSTPFSGEINDLIHQHEYATPVPIQTLNRRVSRRVARVVTSALSRDPDHRPHTAAGFASALKAASEGSGTLLRMAFALYSERFPTFFKVSVAGFTPLILVIILLTFIDKLPGFNPNSSAGISGVVLGIGIILVNLAANIAAYAIVSAVTVPIVVQFMIAPLRQPGIKSAVAIMKRRWRVFSIATLIFIALVLGGAFLFLIPGLLAAVFYALYAPVVMMESLGVRATLKRARILMTRSPMTVLVITLLQFTLPVLVWIVSAHTNVTLKLADDWQPKEFGINFNLSARSSLLQLLSILVTPLSSIMAAMLYLKTRQAGGETLRDIFDQIYRGDLPASRWQARMRNRFRD